MEKLDKVIATLEKCVIDGGCIGCEHNDYSGGFDKCMTDLMRDALELPKSLDGKYRAAVEMAAIATEKEAAAREKISDLRKDIETLHRINEDWRCEVERLHKRIDEARIEGARLSGVAAACENPRTRYAGIRSMSPMQMANWIFHMKAVCDCCDRQYNCGIPDDKVTDEYCLEHILLWLSKGEQEWQEV